MCTYKSYSPVPGLLPAFIDGVAKKISKAEEQQETDYHG